ncbi:response regulator [Sphingosinicella rhizophila]|uniref:Response regulator n=1 Tax=Sphingosinicella rhizophila TaxID=3050082 RepID=A0ABU3Q5R3_9SPHN|nr:response regulator [Sphingosinicella sp. GR2756]MDT9598303.1 response regulator [Sphingosinicella sp. GR2756]
MGYADTHKVALVVDDETFARLFAVQIFLDHGFTVLEAADAAEGLATLDRNDDVAILFTDISMPGEMNGLDLIERAREMRPEITLLLTSGCVEPSRAERPEGVRFLAKPYTAHSLLEAIRGTAA